MTIHSINVPKNNPLQGIDIESWLKSSSAPKKKYSEEPELFMSDEETTYWRRNRPEQQRY